MKRLPIYAVLWAVALLALCVAIGGAGHGLAFPMAVTCAPFPLGYGPSLGLLAIPLGIAFWFFVARAAIRSKPWLCPSLLSLHYIVAAIAFVLVLTQDLRENGEARQTFAGVLVWLVPWAAIYLAGQVALWWAWAHYSRQKKAGFHKKTPWHPRSKPKPIARRRSPKRAGA